MPSSLTRVLSSALGFSPCPPVSVFGTVSTDVISAGAFLGSMGSTSLWGQCPLLITFRGSRRSVCGRRPPRSPPYRLERRARRPLATMALAYPSSSPLRHIPHWCRNISLLPITYAFRPRLRGRLTLGRLALPRKPWAFGEGGFSPPLSLLTPALSLPCPSTAPHGTASRQGTLPYRSGAP